MDPDKGMKYIGIALGVLFLGFIMPWLIYTECRIEVPSRHMAILTKKVGKNIENGDSIAPSAEYKGVQKDVLTEGRYFYNPYIWDWEVVPQIEFQKASWACERDFMAKTCLWVI